jgi:transcriptional regulator with XRE-family HTH domain
VTESKKNPLGPTGERVQANVAHIRGDRGLKYTELSDRLEALGRAIPVLGLSRIERGERRVDADDLVALAIALGVTPNRLLLSDEDGKTEVALTPAVVVSQSQAWAWADGSAIPIAIVAALRPGGRGRDYFAAQEDFALNARPTFERAHGRSRASEAVGDVRQRIRALVEWMAEYERARQGHGKVEPAYDYLGSTLEALGLALTRLQAELAELMSEARRLRTETTPPGTLPPPSVDLGNLDGQR